MERYLTKKRKVEEEEAGDGTETNRDSNNMPQKDSAFRFVQKKGDLFSCSEKEALAHCVSADMRMGKGIAVLFKQKFGGVQELKNQGVVPGGVAVLKRGERFVYYLVTKEIAHHKPTYSKLQASLEAMKTHCEENGVESVSMPRIGCGLDGLSWPKVSDIIKSTFQGTNVAVTVFTI